MNQYYSRSYVLRYTIIGFVAGLILLLFFLFIASVTENVAFTPQGVGILHKSFPAIFFLDLIPIIFALLSFYISKYISVIETDSKNFFENEQTKQRKLYRFVEKLRNNDIDAEYIPEESDVLGKAIVNLRDTLKISKIEESKRRSEDEQRNWIAEGLAKFGEILRADNDNIEVLSINIISNLVKYINANQGGFYLLDDSDKGDKHFKLTACYAYERNKYADKRIEWGEGLVGACALEKETINFKKVPDSYLNITSGLGRSNPRSLLLVPLKLNEEVHGVIEIASFNQFEKYQVDFIEKVAESIASTISTVKINIRTSKLLQESQLQAETLASQEEQMRQNMEELQATQEEAARQSEKFISFTNSVNHTLIRAEYDVNGILIYANTKFLQKLEYTSNSEVEGKHISLFINNKDRKWFDEIWQSLGSGGKHFEGDMKHVTKSGKDLWTIATYTCVRNQFGGVEKILFLAIDTTEQKKLSLDYQGQIDALNRSSLKAEFSPTGDMLEANDKFLTLTGFILAEVRTRSIFDFVPEGDRKGLERIWDDVTHGIPYEGQIKINTKNASECWIRGTFTAVNDIYDEVSKIVLIANDVTREKKMEMETRGQTEQLKIQEEMLRTNEIELNRKLREARDEVKNQFKEIEKVKIRNEKTLEGFLDAIITIDQDGVIQFYNKAAELLFGFEKNSVLGQNIRILFPNDTNGKDEFLSAFLDPNGDKIVGERREITITTIDGSEKNVLMLLSETKIGREVTYTAFIQNISVDLF